MENFKNNKGVNQIKKGLIEIELENFNKAKVTTKLYTGGYYDYTHQIILDDKKYLMRTAKYDFLQTPLIEYIVNKIYEMIDIPIPETRIGTYNGKLVTICKDFLSDGNFELTNLFTVIFNTLESSPCEKLEDMQYPNISLDEILYTIKTQKKVDSNELERFFWKQLIGDFLVGNIANRLYDLELIYDNNNDSYKIAPSHCNVQSFYWYMTNPASTVLSRKFAINEDIHDTTANYLVVNGKSVTPYYILSLGLYSCTKILKGIRNKIDLDKITEFIKGIDCIPQEQQEYYIGLISLRKKLIDSIIENRKEYYLKYIPDKFGNGSKKLCSS